ncbi:hypothetical protein HK099_002687 [Clydaea vesicula]|uniref:LysM domain-containing protein n=1 Tax=Clydaea vesicula TaxID=447962 RepID=A0AAD5TSS3_9FUNG|nr:hypothetical protein HK099_002687 [Clydaea vesicula]
MSALCSSLKKTVLSDTCSSLAFNSKITVSELVSMNPGINCANLSLGTTVCLAQLRLLTERPPILTATINSTLVQNIVTTASAFATINTTTTSFLPATTSSSAFESTASRVQTSFVSSIATNIVSSELTAVDVEKKNGLIIGIASAGVILISSVVLIILCLKRKKRKRMNKHLFDNPIHPIQAGTVKDSLSRTAAHMKKEMDGDFYRLRDDKSTLLTGSTNSINITIGDGNDISKGISAMKYDPRNSETSVSDDKSLNDSFYNLYQHNDHPAVEVFNDPFSNNNYEQRQLPIHILANNLTNNEQLSLQVNDNNFVQVEQRLSEVSGVSSSSSLIMDYALEKNSKGTSLLRQSTVVRKVPPYASTTLKRDITAALTGNSKTSQNQDKDLRLEKINTRENDNVFLAEPSPTETTLTQDELKLLKALH